MSQQPVPTPNMPVNGVALSTPSLNPEPTSEEKKIVSSGRKWRILAALVVMAIMFYLLYRQSSSRRPERQRGGANQGGPFSRLLGGIRDFDASGDSNLVRDDGPGGSAAGIVPRKSGDTNGMPDVGLEKETEESLLELVKDLKKAGFTLQGKTNCRWTKVQRDMFGDRKSKARKELESIYIECLTSEMCPNIRGYPTWVSNNRQFGGFQPPNKLRLMAKEMKQEHPKAMLQGAAEPLDTNIPDAKHNEDIPQPLTPEMARKMFYEMMKDMRANESNSEVAAVESNRSGAGVSINPKGDIGIGAVTDDAKHHLNVHIVKGEDEHQIGDQEHVFTGRKENVRGVSAYAPLNVPDMPGTAPMNLDLQHHDFQTKQGNVSRAAFQNHEPMEDITKQVVTSFQNLNEHARRDPNASSISQTRYPHAADVSTGEPLADKRIPVVKQPLVDQ